MSDKMCSILDRFVLYEEMLPFNRKMNYIHVQLLGKISPAESVEDSKTLSLPDVTFALSSWW